MRWHWAMLGLTMLGVAGCGGGSESGRQGTAPSSQRTQRVGADLPPAPPPPAPAPGKAKKPARAAEEEPAPEPEPVVQREAAKVGVGVKGRDLGTGLIATPITAYFRSQERLGFLQIAQAMNLYKAENGHFPKTHEEFMDQIIKANSIPLPQLPPGSRYVYDPQKAAKMSNYDADDPPLMVEHPRR